MRKLEDNEFYILKTAAKQDGYGPLTEENSLIAENLCLDGYLEKFSRHYFITMEGSEVLNSAIQHPSETITKVYKSDPYDH